MYNFFINTNGESIMMNRHCFLAFVDPFLIIVVVVLLMALGIVASVIVMVVKRRRKQKNEPILTVPATFIGAHSEVRYLNENYSSQTVIETAANRSTSYYAKFRLTSNKKMVFSVKKKVALSYNDGDTGHLTYQGNRFTSFIVTGKETLPRETYFSSRIRNHPWCFLYGEAKSLNININSDKAQKCDQEDLKRLIADLPEDKSDWFFVIENERGDQLQLEREATMKVLCTTLINKEENIKIIQLSELEEFVIKFISAN